MSNPFAAFMSEQELQVVNSLLANTQQVSCPILSEEVLPRTTCTRQSTLEKESASVWDLPLALFFSSRLESSSC